jgi:3-dehydroquinate synthase
MAHMAALTVELGDRSYPIHIGPGLLPRAEMFQPHLRGGRPFILTNETVAPLYLEPLRSALGGSGVEALVLPDGEAHKTLETAATRATACWWRWAAA